MSTAAHRAIPCSLAARLAVEQQSHAVGACNRAPARSSRTRRHNAQWSTTVVHRCSAAVEELQHAAGEELQRAAIVEQQQSWSSSTRGLGELGGGDGGLPRRLDLQRGREGRRPAEGSDMRLLSALREGAGEEERVSRLGEGK